MFSEILLMTRQKSCTFDSEKVVRDRNVFRILQDPAQEQGPEPDPFQDWDIDQDPNAQQDLSIDLIIEMVYERIFLTLFCEWNNITSFLSQEYVSYLSIKDPFQDIRERYNEEKCVSVGTPGGRKKVLASYME